MSWTEENDELKLGGFLFGNLNKDGVLENDELDDEVRMALSSVTRKGLAFNIDVRLASTNPADISGRDNQEANLLSKQAVKAPEIRFTKLFAASATYGARRYVMRKLRMKRKKYGSKPLQLTDDQLVVFKKQQAAIPSLKLSLLSRILYLISGARAKRTSGRLEKLRALEHIRSENLPNEKPIAHAAFPSVDYSDMHPIELTEWEQGIIIDDLQTAESLNKRAQFGPLYTNIYKAIPSDISQRSHGTGSRATSPMVSQASSFSRVPMALPISSSTSRPSSPSNVSTNAQVPLRNSQAARISNDCFDVGTWEKHLLIDENDLDSYFLITSLQLNLNDPHIYFEATGEDKRLPVRLQKQSQRRLKKTKGWPVHRGDPVRFDKPIADRFNISNDKLYEVSKQSKSGNTESDRAQTMAARALSTRTGIQHAVPALKLSMPFYRTFWTKAELRSFHRPKLELTGSSISFDPLLTGKLNAEKKNSSHSLNSAKQLSLREKLSVPSVLEYSEELPPIMMNVGMGISLVTYYRKQNTKESPPVLESNFGPAKVLEPLDPSPFGAFGDVRPGCYMHVAQGSLFRAPLFEHPSPPTDFLALMYKVKGQSTPRYFLRQPPDIVYTVGQLFPVCEVFGPHSRKHNIFCRNRIQAFAYRLFKKDQVPVESRPRIKISRIMAAFPQFSEGSLRKWLKEYADSVRTGQDSGTWRMRPDAPNLNEDDLRALVTPEAICQYESMLAGQQRLNDAGLMDIQEAEGGDEDFDVDNASAEMKLSPWCLTSNFIAATLGKCTLQLRGLGDPSGRGEAFSFVKVPQKMSVGAKLSSAGTLSHSLPDLIPVIDKLTASSAEDFNSKKLSKLSTDQIEYRKEIAKIWEAQAKALAQPAPIEPDDSKDDFSIFELGNTEGPRDTETLSVVSGGSKSSISRGQNKTLVIKRIWKDVATGVIHEESETIEDKRLITAYLSQRRVWESKRKRRLIAAAASAARAKKAKLHDSSEPAKQPSQPKVRIHKPKKEVFVKCGTCGEVGHMRTNRICPQYAVYEAEIKKIENEPSSAAGSSTKISINKALIHQTHPVPAIKLRVSSFSAVEPADAPSPKTPKVDESQILWSKKFEELIESLMSEPESWPFHRPVSRQEYPQYFMIVGEPLDLGTMKQRAKRHKYNSDISFIRDLKLVRDNCLKFNGPDHPFSAVIDKLHRKACGMLNTVVEESGHDAVLIP